MKDFSFSASVVRIALSIPKGKVMTYGSIARGAGGGGQAARSVNGILVKAYRNGETKIPFHRIVYADGRIFSGFSEDKRRMKLYKEEGIIIGSDGKIKNFRDVQIPFK